MNEHLKALVTVAKQCVNGMELDYSGYVKVCEEKGWEPAHPYFVERVIAVHRGQ